MSQVPPSVRSLEIVRPLAFFDLETTGVDVATDRIVELAVLKLLPDGTEQTFHTLINPGVPIPASASEIHGIRDEDVRDKSEFGQIADNFENAGAIPGHNNAARAAWCGTPPLVSCLPQQVISSSPHRSQSPLTPYGRITASFAVPTTRPPSVRILAYAYVKDREFPIQSPCHNRPNSRRCALHAGLLEQTIVRKRLDGATRW
jgi:hypothetical protein